MQNESLNDQKATSWIDTTYVYTAKEDKMIIIQKIIKLCVQIEILSENVTIKP